MLGLLLAGLGLFLFLAAWAGPRFLARHPGLLEAWRFKPKETCIHSSPFKSGSLLGRLMVVVAVLGGLFVLAGPVGATPPDTPPTLTWEVVLPEVGTCDATSLETSRGQDMAVDSVGNIYVLGHCFRSGAISNLPTIWKISPAGSVLATYQPDTVRCATGCDPVGINWDDSGSVVALWQNRSATAGGNDPVLAFISEGSLTGQFYLEGAFWANDIGGGDPGNPEKTMSHREVNASTIQYFLGAPAWTASVTCTAFTEAACSRTYDVTGNPGSLMQNWGGPQQNALYAGDDGSIYKVTTRNTTTGAVVLDSGDLGTNGALTAPWTNTTGSSIYFAHSNVAGSLLLFTELNSTTLAGVRTGATFTDNVLPSQVIMTPANNYLDGANNLFICGNSQTAAGPLLQVFAMKVDTDASPEQRWNVTADINGGSKLEYSVDCELDQDGALLWSFVTCQSASIDCETRVRKYNGAGTARGEEAVFTGFGAGAGGAPSPGNTDAATGLSNFCVAMGFETAASLFLCGLILVAVVVVVMVAATSSFTKGGQAPMIAGGFGGLGMSLFNGFAGIWETWTIAVVIIIAAAIVAHYSRERFGGG